MSRFVVAFLFSISWCATVVEAQSNAVATRQEIVGMWKIVSAASGVKQQPHISYLALNNDSSYVWGIDSAKANPMDGVSKGRWEMTKEGEIKLTFGSNDGPQYVTYYSPITHTRFRMTATDEDGKRTPSIMLETDLNIVKCGSEE